MRGVLDINPEAGTEAARRLGLPRAYPSLAVLLEDPNVQVVHVTSPNQFHYPQVKQILTAGRHVVCEKPLAVTSDESADLVRLAAASDRITAVNFNIRFYRAILANSAPDDPVYATFVDGHHEMLVGDAVARSAREDRWVDVTS